MEHSFLNSMAFTTKTCEHLDHIKEVKQPRAYECEECVKIGADWVHLRTCQNCGVTLCCDSSKYKHARKHSLRNDHYVISSAEPNEQWMYCFKDDLTIKY